MTKHRKILVIILLATMCLALIGCTMTTEELAREVQRNIVQELRDNIAPQYGFHNPRVTSDLVLVREGGGNSYTGLMVVEYECGTSFRYTVNVVYDGRSFFWELSW